MYDGIYLVFIRSLCIFVDILTVCSFIFFNIKYEFNITLNRSRAWESRCIRPLIGFVEKQAAQNLNKRYNTKHTHLYQNRLHVKKAYVYMDYAIVLETFLLYLDISLNCSTLKKLNRHIAFSYHIILINTISALQAVFSMYY